MRKKKKRNLLILLTLLLVTPLLALTLFGGWWYLNLQPADPQTTATKSFMITAGQGVEAVAAKLEEQGLIRNSLAFKLLVMQEGIGKNIQAGRFFISPSMTTKEIAYTLTKAQPEEVWVKVLEGWRREEIAEVFETTLEKNRIPFDKQKFLELTEDKEGYLFPDSYLISKDATEAKIVSLLENTFNKKITPEMKAEIQRQGKTLDEVVTMASLIEREANDDTARAMVSGILWKRIENNWPLQVDATLQYARGYDRQSKSWWKSPTRVDKAINSPYNTYQNPGLPPGPIASPSLSSLKAAIYPKNSDYWYYITGRDGKMYYAETLEEHNQNIQKYLR